MKYEKYALALVRISISLVFLWFGFNQTFLPEDFMGYLPNFILALESARSLIIINGIFELVFGFLLLIGLFIRPVALILTLNLLSIALGLGYNDIAVRDFGLTLITFAIFLGGDTTWSLDRKRHG